MSKRGLSCPKCGSTDITIEKTWQLVSPIPDSAGRITITVMGVVRCNSCGYRWRATISKLKVGGSSVELEGGKKIEQEETRKPKEIVLDLDEILSGEEENG
ncbi:chromatin protein Cren7 [Thermogladius sp. 4427co]|uniref:chromatin protein Cren7 n=1 Tax=Thermogladius sp. 4427co TaxID=3450718 RepID=UPI003F78D729